MLWIFLNCIPKGPMLCIMESCVPGILRGSWRRTVSKRRLKKKGLQNNFQKPCVHTENEQTSKGSKQCVCTGFLKIISPFLPF